MIRAPGSHAAVLEAADAEAVPADSGPSNRLRQLRHRVGGARRASPLLIVALVVGMAGFLLLPNHLLYSGSTAMAAGIVGLGLFLPMAALGEMALHGAGMAGLGAYLFAYYGSQGGAGDHFLGIAAALAAVLAVSLLAGFASLVVTGLYFVVATLVIQVAMEKVIFPIPELTGGASGRTVWQPIRDGWFSTHRIIYLVAAVIALLCAVVVWRLLRSRTGFHAMLVGHAPEGATSTGVRNWVVKLEVFALSGLLIGVAGLLFAFVPGTPPPSYSFAVVYSVIFIAIPIAGGMRDLSSIFLVAAAFTCIPIVLESYKIPPNFLSGIILLTALMLGRHRDWIADQIGRLRGLLPGPAAATPELNLGEPVAAGEATSYSGNRPVAALVPLSSSADREPPSGAQQPQGALVATDMLVAFGGVRAVDGVCLRVEPGERLGIVGANGAGKSTLFNALSGFVPFAGTVTLGGTDITTWPAFARARAGLRRTFQQPRLADLLTVEQNVICGHGHDRERRDRVDSLLEHFDLSSYRRVPVAALPFGMRRTVEVIRALSRPPQILLLDEPVSGLENEEAERLSDILVQLQSQEGWGLVVIEHDLDFITGLAHTLMVMENGVALTHGLLDDVLQQEEVQRVYLGEAVTV